MKFSPIDKKDSIPSQKSRWKKRAKVAGWGAILFFIIKGIVTTTVLLGAFFMRGCE